MQDKRGDLSNSWMNSNLIRLLWKSYEFCIKFIVPIHIPSPYTPSVRVNKISFEDIDRATQQCIKLLNKFSETENNLILKGF
jgi:hypothetical protein